MITSQQWIPFSSTLSGPLARYLAQHFAIARNRRSRRPLSASTRHSVASTRRPGPRTLLTRLAGIAQPSIPGARISTSPCFMIRAARLLPCGFSLPCSISYLAPTAADLSMDDVSRPRSLSSTPRFDEPQCHRLPLTLPHRLRRRSSTSLSYQRDNVATSS